MTNQSKTNSTAKSQSVQSSLGKFQLAFEYDRTWNEAKRTVQLRPTKK